MDVVARDDPTLRFPAGCRTWACEVCGPRKAREKAEIIAWAEPQRFVTLTQAPADWQAVRMKVRRLRHRVATDGYSTEWAWTVEKGSKTGMVHVHALQHGDFLPQSYLQDRWGRIVHVRKVDGHQAAAGYAMKEALTVAGYVLKEARGAQLRSHLDLNGGRGCHLSRRYLHGKRSDEVWRILHPPDEHDWVLVPMGSPFPPAGYADTVPR